MRPNHAFNRTYEYGLSTWRSSLAAGPVNLVLLGVADPIRGICKPQPATDEGEHYLAKRDTLTSVVRRSVVASHTRGE